MVYFIEDKFIKYYLGSRKIRSHIDAVHACPPKSDELTGEIVEGVINEVDCSGIIAIASRTKADLNRPRNDNNKEAIDEYRQTIKHILEHINNLNKDGKSLKPFLHLAIHGMSDRRKEDIEIGTLFGKTCSLDVKHWFINEIENHIKKIKIDKRFPGDPSKSAHRCGDQTSDLNYLGYGANFNTFQIEINRMLRKSHQKELINIFSDIIIRFNEQF